MEYEVEEIGQVQLYSANFKSAKKRIIDIINPDEKEIKTITKYIDAIIDDRVGMLDNLSFCVDIEVLLGLLHIRQNTKEEIKQAFVDGLYDHMEGIDYKCTLYESNRSFIVLRPSCFKRFLLCSETKVGKVISKYFVQIEKIYRCALLQKIKTDDIDHVRQVILQRLEDVGISDSLIDTVVSLSLTIDGACEKDVLKQKVRLPDYSYFDDESDEEIDGASEDEENDNSDDESDSDDSDSDYTDDELEELLVTKFCIDFNDVAVYAKINNIPKLRERFLARFDKNKDYIIIPQKTQDAIDRTIVKNKIMISVDTLKLMLLVAKAPGFRHLMQYFIFVEEQVLHALLNSMKFPTQHKTQASSQQGCFFYIARVTNATAYGRENVLEPNKKPVNIYKYGKAVKMDKRMSQYNVGRLYRTQVHYFVKVRDCAQFEKDFAKHMKIYRTFKRKEFIKINEEFLVEKLKQLLVNV